jgi:hypothetical protein
MSFLWEFSHMLVKVQPRKHNIFFPNFMPQPPTAFAGSERCFRRYETVIKQALQNYPNSVSFTPTLSVTTEVARCRDSISSYRKHGWVVDNSEVFSLLADPRTRLNVWTDGTLVFIGDKEYNSDIDPRSPNGFATSVDTDHRHVLLEPETKEHLAYLIVLIDDGVFPFSISIDLKWHETATILIGDRLNVACHPESDRLLIY